MDVIEKQAINDVFVKLQQDCFKDGHLDEWFFLVQVAKEFNKIPSAEPERKTERWIPCSERLPEHDNHVLCCTVTAKGKKNIIIGYYLHGSDRWVSGMNSNVIAWMELPDPYGEAVDD